MRPDLTGELEAIAGKDRVLVQEPLAAYTTFRIGGPADYLVRPSDKAQIRAVMELCREHDVPVAVIGNGSNLLVSDAGFRGVILRLDQHFQQIKVEENTITAQAGLLLTALAAAAREHALAGLEYASGIPGTVGGAVWMNAGAYGGEIRDSLVSVDLLTRDLEERRATAEEMELSYRHSRAMDEGWILLEAVFSLETGDPVEIAAKTEEFRRRRTEKQPLNYPSAGSTFKRPEGYFAGKLIMEAGLSGLTVGGAQVSEKHCGFVINRGGATAEDVRTLIRTVQERVMENAGVLLEPEVRFLGMEEKA